MSFLSSTEKEDVSLLINIGNGGISISFVSYSKNQTPNFLYSVNAPYLGEKSNTSKLSDSLNLLLDSLLGTAIKEGWSDKYWKNKHKKFSSVVVTFSSPWLTLKTREIHLAKDNAFVLTKRFVNDIVSKEEEIFKKDLEKSTEENSEGQFEIIESSMVHTKINGYTINDVIGRKTKSLDAFLYMSAISKNVRGKISDIILKHTHIPKENISMHSFLLVMFSTIRDNFSKNSDFMYMDVNSEVSDIVLVTDDVIRSVVSFPFGRNTIIRQISKIFNVNLEIAQSQMTLYMVGKVSDSLNESMNKLLIDLESEWAVYIEDALFTISPSMVFPAKLFFATDQDTSSIFIDYLKLQKNDSTVNFRKNLELTYMNDSVLSVLYKNENKMEIDEILVILSIFYNKLYQENNK